MPEKVPFRLTPNLKEALGVSGIEVVIFFYNLQNVNFFFFFYAFIIPISNKNNYNIGIPSDHLTVYIHCLRSINFFWIF